MTILILSVYPLDILLCELLCPELAVAGGCIPYLLLAAGALTLWVADSTSNFCLLLARGCLGRLTALVLYAGAFVCARTKPVAYNTTHDRCDLEIDDRDCRRVGGDRESVG
ncbi:MAG: hypothetical protein ACRC62_06825 [Microcoleus sp.]